MLIRCDLMLFDSILCYVIGGVAELNCQTMGEPKPSVEWILADGNKV